jgi:hypothetical protein
VVNESRPPTEPMPSLLDPQTKSESRLRIAVLCRRSRGKIHYVPATAIGEERPATGTTLTGRSLCGRVSWADDWTVVDYRWLREQPDAGESLVCRDCS